MRTLDGPAANMADVLKEWREAKGISKYAIAKYENIRIEVVTACEEGRASMGGLCMYLDFIAEKDRESSSRTLRKPGGNGTAMCK